VAFDDRSSARTSSQMFVALRTQFLETVGIEPGAA
jgi:hypothetical protein